MELKKTIAVYYNRIKTKRKFKKKVAFSLEMLYNTIVLVKESKSIPFWFGRKTEGGIGNLVS